jgi:hypothetical protein
MNNKIIDNFCKNYFITTTFNFNTLCTFIVYTKIFQIYFNYPNYLTLFQENHNRDHRILKLGLFFLHHLRDSVDGSELARAKILIDNDIPFEKIPAGFLPNTLSLKPSNLIFFILNKETGLDKLNGREIEQLLSHREKELYIDIEQHKKLNEIEEDRSPNKNVLIGSLTKIIKKIPESWWRFIFKSNDFDMLSLLCNGGYSLSSVPLEWTQKLAHRDIGTFLLRSKKCRESVFDLMIFDRYYWGKYTKDNAVSFLHDFIMTAVPPTITNKIKIPDEWIKSLKNKSQGNIENSLTISRITNLKSMDRSSGELIKQQFIKTLKEITDHSLLIKCKKIGLNVDQVPASIITAWESEISNIRELYSSSASSSELMISITTSIINQMHMV